MRACRREAQRWKGQDSLMKILNFGSLNLDYVYHVDHIILPGETELADDIRLFAGGKGLNQSVALARAGAPVWHAGLIGGDGGMLRTLLEDSGVHTDYLKTDPDARTGHTIIQVDRNGQNSILLSGGTNRMITDELANETLAHFSEGDVLVLQNEISALPHIIDRAFGIGMKIVMNPSPYDGHIASCDLSKVSLFLINEVEGMQIAGVGDPDAILRTMAERYPDADVVLTLGSAGSVFSGHGQTVRQSIFHVHAVDTTAAGDTFTGYFVSSFFAGRPVKECMELASKASAISVSRNGAAPSIPSLEEVREADLH